MFLYKSSAQDLIVNFEKEMKLIKQASNVRHEKFLFSGVENLIKAADLLDQAGLTKAAEQLTQVIEKLAWDVSHDKAPSSEQMVKNLLDHGHPLDKSDVKDESEEDVELEPVKVTTTTVLEEEKKS